MYLLKNLALLLSFMMMTKGLAVDHISESDEKENGNILPRSLSDDDSEFRLKVATFLNHLVEYFLEERTKNAKNEMNLSRDKLESSENWSEADLSQYWSKILGTGNEVKTFNKKFTKKWPHCRNVGCKFGVTRWEFDVDCSRNSECDGYSFTTGQPLRGKGCMKSCGNDESSEGYGSSGFDYWKKDNQGTEVFVFDGDDLMATNWDDNIKYWRGLANEVQDSIMFKSIKDSLKVYYIKTEAQTFMTMKEDYGIVGLAKDNNNNHWVIFPGAQGIQLHYGTESVYRNFALAGEKRKSSYRVHKNYYNAFRATRFIMQEFLADARNEVIFTGHSKGGLQATHAAYYMATEKSGEFQIARNKVSLYVFGTPNLGNKNVSKKLSNYVKHFKEAVWYNVKRTMKCGIFGSTYRFYDIIEYNHFAYRGNDGDQDWIKTHKYYYPRGISQEHDFYTPKLDESEFDYRMRNGQTWRCDLLSSIDWLYHKGYMSRREEFDYEFGNRVKSHQLSYALSSQD